MSPFSRRTNVMPPAIFRLSRSEFPQHQSAQPDRFTKASLFDMRNTSIISDTLRTTQIHASKHQSDEFD